MIKYRFIRGDTIVELMLYMGLLSIFLVALFNLFAAILSVQTRSTAVSLIQTNSNFLLAKLNYDINQADDIISPSAVGSSAVSLTLKTNLVNSTYTLNNGYLQLNDGAGVNNLNDNNTSISNLTFQRIGNVGGKNAIQIKFTITSLVVDNSATKSADIEAVISTR